MTSHSSRDQLLRYLDGELSSSVMRETATHLQACWSCQVELDRLKQHIALIVDAETEVLGSSLPPPPRPWPRLEPRLEKATESGIPFWRKLAIFAPLSRMSLAYGSSALGLLIIAMMIWVPVATVSAKEALSKAIVAGKERQSIAPQQVIRQRVRVKKIAAGAGDRTAALESWKSSKSAYWNSGADPLNTELLARYQAIGLAAALPLSPGAMESWARLAGSEPSASSEGNHVDVEVVANAAGQARGLKAVSFHVQKSNWHMDQMTLSFADATFQISEEESSILGRHEVSKEILARLEPKVDNFSLTSRPDVPANSALSPGVASESTPNLDDLEIDVRHALHEMGADLGEGIEIAVRPPGLLVVNAAGASPQRKEQLKKLFGNQPKVRLEFEEPANGAASGQTPAKTTVISDADRSSQAGGSRLSQYFGSPTEQENHARSVLETSTGILARLYALKELAARWPASSQDRLSADSKAKLISILREHARELQTGTSTLRKDLRVILKGDPTKGQPAATGGMRWQEASSSGLDSAFTVDRTLRALLTISDSPLSLDQAVPKLHQASGDLEAAVNALTRSLN